MKSLFVLLLIYLLPCSVLQAEANFEDRYGISANDFYPALADQVVATRFDETGLSLRQKLTRLKNLQARIDEKLGQLPDDPLIWFLSGLNQNNLAEVQYLIVLDQSGQQKASADIDVSNYNIARSRAYDNAIRLDNPQPHRLSSSIYATMGYGLGNRQKIETYSRELAIGSPGENESNEWFMHWAKVDALVQEKKLDEAQQALSELKGLLQKKNKTSSPYASIVDRAETQVAIALMASEQRNPALIENSEATALKTDNEIPTWTWKNWLLVGIGFFTFSFVIAAAIHFRKS